MNVIVIGAEPGSYTIPVEQFQRAAQAHWTFSLVQPESTTDDVTDMTVLVERPGEPAFHIFHSRSGHSVFTDGIPSQAAEVAAWVISSFPPQDGVEVWLTDEAFTQHVILTSGMTPEMIATDWQATS